MSDRDSFLLQQITQKVWVTFPTVSQATVWSRESPLKAISILKAIYLKTTTPYLAVLLSWVVLVPLLKKKKKIKKGCCFFLFQRAELLCRLPSACSTEKNSCIPATSTSQAAQAKSLWTYWLAQRLLLVFPRTNECKLILMKDCIISKHQGSSLPEKASTKNIWA